MGVKYFSHFIVKSARRRQYVSLSLNKKFLDHYAFEEVQGYNIMEDNTNNDHNGTAFLQELQRVRNIREQLKITF